MTFTQTMGVLTRERFCANTCQFTDWLVGMTIMTRDGGVRRQILDRRMKGLAKMAKMAKMALQLQSHDLPPWTDWVRRNEAENWGV